ncbi:hypothetical protein [Polaribacter sp.]|uniref:hypothetical protein n=1 Tax=Polaribacter sp. TaxID=1920175 RepID=UPI003EF6B5D9
MNYMNAAGNACQLESYAGKDHGFFNGPFIIKKKADKIVYNDLMEKSYAFVKARFNNSELKLSNIFSNHIILQRGIKVPVWGTATPGQKVLDEVVGIWSTQTPTSSVSLAFPYYLEEDKYQTTNLYNQYPEVVKEMEAILNRYKTEIN